MADGGVYSKLCYTTGKVRYAVCVCNAFYAGACMGDAGVTVRRVLKTFVLAALVVLPVMAADVLRFAFWPDVAVLKKENPAATEYMRFRESLAERPVPKLRWVPLGQISPWLVRAVTIAEDDRFWDHEGFDTEGMRQAFLRNLREGRLAAGGSSISQQLAKNLYLSPDRTLSRKLKEALLTWRLEATLSKRRILEIYLNVIEWGDGIYGINAASRHFFGVEPAALSPAQSARLASVLPAPRRYSPVSDSGYVIAKSRVILRRMQRRSWR